MQFYCTKKYMSWFLYFDIILKNDFLYQNSMLDILLFITIPKIVPSFYSFVYRDSRIYTRYSIFLHDHAVWGKSLLISVHLEGPSQNFDETRWVRDKMVGRWWRRVVAKTQNDEGGAVTGLAGSVSMTTDRPMYPPRSRMLPSASQHPSSPSSLVVCPLSTHLPPSHTLAAILGNPLRSPQATSIFPYLWPAPRDARLLRF